MDALVINKIADIQDLNQIARSAVVERLLKTKYTIDKLGVPYSDHMQDNWLRLWEYSGAIIWSQVDKRMRVLDAGGTGTIFSYYLAIEGCEVHTIDIDGNKVIDAEQLTKKLGIRMFHSVSRIEELTYPDEYFDVVFCICVVEHIKKDIQMVAIQQLARTLKSGGVLALTFDYGSHGADNPLLSAKEITDRLVIPSGLQVIGNEIFVLKSSDYRYTDLQNTFGSLFLRKEGNLNLDVNRLPSVKIPILIDWVSKDIRLDYYRCMV